MASKRIEEQVEQNYTAIQTLIDNAKKLHELPSIISFEDDDRFLVQIDSTRESVYVTFKELISYIEVAAATFIGLGDTPSTFQSQNRKNVKVNSIGTALEFTPDYLDLACSDEESDLVVKPSVFKMVCNRDYKNVSHIHFSVTTAPTGTPIILDLWKNGASIMNIQPEIEIGDFSTHTSATPGSIDLLNEDFDIGDELRISVEQIGSTIAGVGLKATIVYNNYTPE